MKRDILDYQGNKIGELSEPTGTTWPEEIWQDKLAAYSQPPKTRQLPSVTPRQIRQALVLSGVSMEAVDSAINSLPPELKSMAKIEWEYSIAFYRDNKFVGMIGQMMGWGSDKLDDLWILAGGF